MLEKVEKCTLPECPEELCPGCGTRTADVAKFFPNLVMASPLELNSFPLAEMSLPPPLMS